MDEALTLIDKSMTDLSKHKLEDTGVVIDLLLDIRALIANKEGE